MPLDVGSSARRRRPEKARRALVIVYRAATLEIRASLSIETQISAPSRTSLPPSASRVLTAFLSSLSFVRRDDEDAT